MAELTVTTFQSLDGVLLGPAGGLKTGTFALE